MELFELKDGLVTFSPTALTLEPFKVLWKRDKSKDKIIAILELSYIFHFADYKSDFSDIVEPKERTEEIVKVLFPKESKWKPDEKVQVAIDFYKERSETITTKLLENAMLAVHKVSTYFANVNLEEIDDRGKPIHDAKKLADTVGSLDKLIDSLTKVEEKVKKEKQVKDRMRGNTEMKLFENGI